MITTFIIYLIIILPFTHSLRCMEIWHKPTTKDDIHCALAQHYFSHDSICALALVNKQWNTFIQTTAIDRQLFLTNQEEYRKNCGDYKQITWHKHNSAYAYWITSNKDCDKRNERIIFHLVHLNGNNDIRTQTYSSHQYDINGKAKRGSATARVIQQPFFNSKGDISFHVFQWYGEREIMEYVLSAQEAPKKFYCSADCLPKNIYGVGIPSLAMFDNHPIVLKAFIHSKQIHEFRDPLKDLVGSKIYSAEGIELDENYIINETFPSKDAIISRCIIKKS